jgi:hypothetical protein
MFYRKKILHFCGYWKIILFVQLRMTPILVDHDTDCIEKNIMSLYFHAYKKHSNERSYAPCALIWRQGGTGLWIGNKYEKKINMIWINWKNKDIRHKHGKEIYMIEIFVINVLWKGIISYLWVYGGARLNVLWKGNIIFLLWVLKNDFISTNASDSDFSWPWDRLYSKDYLLIFPCI